MVGRLTSDAALVLEITYELNRKPGDALWWGKPAYLLQPCNKLAPKPRLRSAPLLEEAQKGLL